MQETRTQTVVQLTETLVAALDREASAQGESRSALVRRALQHYLDEHGSASIGHRIAEGYRRIPPGQPDEWGDLEELALQGTDEMLQRLDAEERAAGHEAW